MPAKTSNFANDLVRQGYAVVRNVVPADMQQKLRDLCTQSPQQFTARRQGESYSIRHLLSALPGLREIANAPPLIDLAIAVLGDAVRPVKGVFFDKTPLANWPVPWHQDSTITVQERIDVPGFEMRPVKDGVVHTRPPLDVSENLLTLESTWMIRGSNMRFARHPALASGRSIVARGCQ